MLALLLTIAVTQTPAPSPILRDLEFTAAVEASIASEPGTAPPEPFGSLIRDLGDSSYRKREAASAKLTEASRGDVRYLFWGRMSRDLEVRLRSNSIIRMLYPCPSCRGSGRSRDYHKDPCWFCAGGGSSWWWSAWD